MGCCVGWEPPSHSLNLPEWDDEWDGGFPSTAQLTSHRGGGSPSISLTNSWPDREKGVSHDIKSGMLSGIVPKWDAVWDGGAPDRLYGCDWQRKTLLFRRVWLGEAGGVPPLY